MAKQRGRGQGEGSIFKRKDGRWAAAINLGWRNGKRHRKWFYGTTRHNVQKELTKALRAQQQGLPVAPERQTVGQFLNQWLDDCCAPSVRPATLRSYRDIVRLHIQPVLGKIQLSKLSAQHVQAFLNAKLKEKKRITKSKRKNADVEQKAVEETPSEPEKLITLSPRTVQYIGSVLSRALNRAVKWDLVPRNVARLATPPRVPQHEIAPFTPEEARKFLKKINGTRNEALYTVAIAIGLRKGEALGLGWDDIDLEGATLRVRHALQRVKGTAQLVEPKSERSRRTLPVPAVALKALRAHRARQLQERLLAGSNWQNTGLVFTTRIGTPMDERRVSKHFKAALTSAGLRAQRFHDLRHACASLLLAQGVHPRGVMEVLGHSQISLTMNTYSHVMPTLLRDAADKMNAVLGGGT